MTDDLVAFLRRMLDADEQAAHAARGGGTGRWAQDGPPWNQQGRINDECGNPVTYDEGEPTGEQAEHIARWDPARVLADVDAKRRIVAWHRKPTRTEFENGTYRTMGCRCYGGWPCETLRLLAAPYAEHDGYRPEWAPDA